MSDDRWVIDFTVDPEIDFNLKERLELYKKALSDLESNKDFNLYEMKLGKNETRYLYYHEAKNLIEYFYHTLSTLYKSVAREDVSVDIDINIDKVKADKILQEGLVKLTPDIAQEDLTELSDKLSQGIIARYKDYFVLPMLVDDKPVMPMSEKSMDDISAIGMDKRVRESVQYRFNGRIAANEEIYFFTPEQILQQFYQDNLNPQDDLFNIFSLKFRSMFTAIKKRKEDILKQGINVYDGDNFWISGAKHPKFDEVYAMIRPSDNIQLQNILASLEVSKEKNMNVVIPLRIKHHDVLNNYESIMKIPAISSYKLFKNLSFMEVNNLDAKKLLTDIEFQKYKDLKENIPNKLSLQEIRNMNARKFLTVREQRAQKQMELRENVSLVNERMTIRDVFIRKIKDSGHDLMEDIEFRKNLGLLKEQEFIDLVDEVGMSEDEFLLFLKEEKILFQKNILPGNENEYVAKIDINPINIDYLNRLLSSDKRKIVEDDLDYYVSKDYNTYTINTKLNSTSQKLSILTKNIENKLQETDDYQKIVQKILDTYKDAFDRDTTGLFKSIKLYESIYSGNPVHDEDGSWFIPYEKSLTQITQNTYRNIRDKTNQNKLLTRRDISSFLDQVKGGELEIDLGFIMTGGGENFNQLDEHTRQIINTYIKEFVINTLYKALD